MIDASSATPVSRISRSDCSACSWYQLTRSPPVANALNGTK
jgi:hypothetical protein